MAYAHSRNAHGARHDLTDHLRGVAQLAEEFAAPFGSGEAARYIGLWHDIGKFHPAWQQYLLDSEAGRVTRGHGPDHKAAGAQLAVNHVGALALLIQGHHGGLQDPTALKGWLADKLKDPAVMDALEQARQSMPDLEPTRQVQLPEYATRDPYAAELFLRPLSVLKNPLWESADQVVTGGDLR